MTFLVYALCALTAFACALLLLRASRQSVSRMLFWSGICFALLTVSNLLLIVDAYVFPDIRLWSLRHGISLLAVSVLLYGLIFEER